VLEIEVFVTLKYKKKLALSYFVIWKYGKLQIGVGFQQNSFNWKASFSSLKKTRYFKFHL
jgi:hypothetical protein